MAINQIKVANEAKQDITINKADQILGRLTDQTVIAKTVKSVQTGIYFPPSTLQNFTAGARVDFATISPIGGNCLLTIESFSNNGSAVIYGTDGTYLTAELVGSKIVSEVIPTPLTRGHIYKFKWTVIEFY